MAEIFVTNTDGLEEGAVKVIAVANEEIGVIRHKGQCYAYLNRCPHQGWGCGCRRSKPYSTTNSSSSVIAFPRRKTTSFALGTATSSISRTVAALATKRYEVVERQGGVYVVV